MSYHAPGMIGSMPKSIDGGIGFDLNLDNKEGILWIKLDQKIIDILGCDLVNQILSFKMDDDTLLKEVQTRFSKRKEIKKTVVTRHGSLYDKTIKCNLDAPYLSMYKDWEPIIKESISFNQNDAAIGIVKGKERNVRMAIALMRINDIKVASLNGEKWWAIVIDNELSGATAIDITDDDDEEDTTKK